MTKKMMLLVAILLIVAMWFNAGEEVKPFQSIDHAPAVENKLSFESDEPTFDTIASSVEDSVSEREETLLPNTDDAKSLAAIEKACYQNQRINSPDFQEMHEDIQQYFKEQADKTCSQKYKKHVQEKLARHLELRTPSFRMDNVYYELNTDENGELYYREVDLRGFTPESYALSERFYYEELETLNVDDQTFGEYSPENENFTRQVISGFISEDNVLTIDMVVCRELKCMVVITIDHTKDFPGIEISEQLEKMGESSQLNCSYGQIPTQKGNLLIDITCKPNTPAG